MAKSSSKGNSSPTTGGPGLSASLKQLSGNGPITLEDWDAERFARMMDLVTASGGAVIVGRTSDGGAHAFTFLVGTDKHKAYATSSADLDAIANAVDEALSEDAGL